MSIFENKTLMITGGTGSFGNAVLNRFLATDIKEIRVFSRGIREKDEKQQLRLKLTDFTRIPLEFQQFAVGDAIQYVSSLAGE